jgi:thiamine biosynthesis protein ThiI
MPNVVVRYHEIALKGRNRPFFVDKLATSLRRATADLPGIRVRSVSSRLLLDAPEEVSWALLRERIGRVFGVANFSLVGSCAPTFDALRSSVLEWLEDREFATFRVTTKRSNKRFPKRSGEVDRELGAAILATRGGRVDLERPELNVRVEILEDRCLFTDAKLPGPGGMPVGSSGRLVALLSGGIDSPVAAWRLMKRGSNVSLVNFHAYPLQDRTMIDKVRKLAQILTRWQHRTRLFSVPFGRTQQAIVASAPAPLRVVLYRRMMIRIGEAVAGRCGARALVTGESLAQVASQTLDNLAVIDEAAEGPILRPLVGMDKAEITEQARLIGSYEVSTLPDQDCCQLFVPRRPATAAKLDEVLRAEEGLDVAGMVLEALDGTEESRIEYPVDAGVAPRRPFASGPPSE